VLGDRGQKLAPAKGNGSRTTSKAKPKAAAKSRARSKRPTPKATAKSRTRAAQPTPSAAASSNNLTNAEISQMGGKLARLIKKAIEEPNITNVVAWGGLGSGMSAVLRLVQTHAGVRLQASFMTGAVGTPQASIQAKQDFEYSYKFPPGSKLALKTAYKVRAVGDVYPMYEEAIKRLPALRGVVRAALHAYAQDPAVITYEQYARMYGKRSA